MIDTFFSLNTLDTTQAFWISLLIGLFFGIFLEQAGFGSSRKLSSIFYFRDMSVLKVMFSALIVGMLGLAYAEGLGLIELNSLYILPSIYGAQIVGGLIFGIGFVMGGWCPGTATTGLASGKIDALLFLIGTILGSVFFNEVYLSIQSLYLWGDNGVQFLFDSVSLSKSALVFIISIVAILSFWGSEYIERIKGYGGQYLRSPFLIIFSFLCIITAAGYAYIPVANSVIPAFSSTAFEQTLLQDIETAQDHFEPEDLADRLMNGDSSLLVVDVRTPQEYQAFHIRGAVFCPITELNAFLSPYNGLYTIILYSNGMTHPAQARDALTRMGYKNVFHLTDGLNGFRDRCLKPASLHSEPVSGFMKSKILKWRQFFIYQTQTISQTNRDIANNESFPMPGMIETEWLEKNLDRQNVKIIDVRPQQDYNTAHIPQSVCLSAESIRGVVRGISSMLLPSNVLVSHFSLIGLRPDDIVVLVYGDSLRDATLIGMAFERLGHRKYGLLRGGYPKWFAEKRSTTNQLPDIASSVYPDNPTADTFTVNAEYVLKASINKKFVIIDARPADYYNGQKSNEARAGHIPNALNRPYTEDTLVTDSFGDFKPIPELQKVYNELIPDKDSTVIVYCRTGHQASQTFFILKHILGYNNVLWYDAGWSEWSARLNLPNVIH